MSNPEDNTSNFDDLDHLLDPTNPSDSSKPKPSSASDIAAAALSPFPDMPEATTDIGALRPELSEVATGDADLAPTVAVDAEVAEALGADALLGGAIAAATAMAGEESATPGEDSAATEEAPEKAEEEKEEEEKEKKPGLLQKLANTDPYAVLLMLAFVALVIACLVMFSEWGSYKYITKPKAIKKAISAAPLQPGPARTTATA